MNRRIIAFARENVVCAVAAAVFTWMVNAGGIPALRHDWWWGDSPEKLRSVLVASMTGWFDGGIGAANTYPTSFLIQPLRVFCGLTIGSSASCWLMWFLCGFAFATAVANLTRMLGAPTIAQRTLALAALFSPFCYTRIVAGHFNMLVALTGLALIAGEAMRPKPRRVVLALAVAATVGQIQYFLLAVLPLAVALRRARDLRVGTLWLLLALPTLVGVSFDSSAIAGLPLNLDWERVQSLAPLDALLQRGYFAGYAAAFERLLPTIGECVFILIASGGAIAGLRRPPYRFATAFGLVATLGAIVVSMGLNGPLALPIAEAFANISAAGVFRELADFSGIAMLGIVALAALACARSRTVIVFAIGATGAIISAWFVTLPSSFFVDARIIPHVDPAVATGTRFALYPSLQPMRFRGRGSGLDPDAYDRANGTTAVNTYLPSFPNETALDAYSQRGDRRSLEALGVSCAIVRPYLASNESLRERNAIRTRRASASLKFDRDCAFRPLPLATIDAVPDVVATFAPLDSLTTIFAGDAATITGSEAPPGWRALPAINSVHASRRYLSATEHWVDARYVFTARPELAQGYGGAATTSHESFLIEKAGSLLAFVHGTMVRIDGTTIASDTGLTYHWTAPVNAGERVYCRGLCIIAASSAIVPRTFPRKRSDTPMPQSLAISRPMSWLAIITIPPGPTAIVRYNVAYDGAWFALDDRKMLSHARVGTSFNGWFLPTRNAPTQMIAVEIVALVQLGLECVGIFAFLLWVVPRPSR